MGDSSEYSTCLSKKPAVPRSRTAAEFLRSVTDADRVSLVGEGTGAYHALYAAGAAEGVEHVVLRGLRSNFTERVTDRVVP